MLLVGGDLLKAIADAAEAAYPAECCGLLIGRGGRTPRVTRVVPSANLATGNDRFEIDPALRLHWMRALRDGPERILGHYHSHPDHPAEPSATDRAMAFEPELHWLIAAVRGGQCIQIAAWRPAAEGFRPVRMRIAEKTS